MINGDGSDSLSNTVQAKAKAAVFIVEMALVARVKRVESV